MQGARYQYECEEASVLILALTNLLLHFWTLIEESSALKNSTSNQKYSTYLTNKEENIWKDGERNKRNHTGESDSKEKGNFILIKNKHQKKSAETKGQKE